MILYYSFLIKLTIKINNRETKIFNKKIQNNIFIEEKSNESFVAPS